MTDIPQRIAAVNETIRELKETIRVMGEPKGWCLARSAGVIADHIAKLAETVDKMASQKGEM